MAQGFGRSSAFTRYFVKCLFPDFILLLCFNTCIITTQCQFLVLNDLPVRQLVESTLVLVFFLDFRRLLLHGDAAPVRNDRLFIVDRFVFLLVSNFRFLGRFSLTGMSGTLVLPTYCECLRSILGVLNTRARSEERFRSALHSWPVDGRQVRGRVVTQFVYELFLALQLPSSNKTATFLSSLASCASTDAKTLCRHWASCQGQSPVLLLAWCGFRGLESRTIRCLDSISLEQELSVGGLHAPQSDLIVLKRLAANMQTEHFIPDAVASHVISKDGSPHPVCAPPQTSLPMQASSLRLPPSKRPRLIHTGPVTPDSQSCHGNAKRAMALTIASNEIAFA